MFALVLIALPVLLAFASLAVLADCSVRWWSAFGALKRQLAHDGRVCTPVQAAAIRRSGDHSRTLGSRQSIQRVALRVAA